MNKLSKCEAVKRSGFDGVWYLYHDVSPDDIADPALAVWIAEAKVAHQAIQLLLAEHAKKQPCGNKACVPCMGDDAVEEPIEMELSIEDLFDDVHDTIEDVAPIVTPALLQSCNRHIDCYGQSTPCCWAEDCKDCYDT